jgi:hypothetical protein
MVGEEMKKAIISPNEAPIQYISGWTETNPETPIYSAYANSCRVAEVCDTEFEIAPPLFWADCADDVVADQFYYDTATSKILPIVNAPPPVTEQPTTDLPNA